jgi:hypothetical protein
MAQLLGKSPEAEYYGYEAARECIEDSLEYDRRVAEIRERDPEMALHPSMHTIDARGRLHHQGPGSDRGLVRRFIFRISTEQRPELPPEWMAAAAQDQIVSAEDDEAEKVSGLGADFRLIEGPNYWECPVSGCNYRKMYEENNEEDRRRARGAMRTHMSMIKKQVEDHREAKVVIFG